MDLQKANQAIYTNHLSGEDARQGPLSWNTDHTVYQVPLTLP